MCRKKARQIELDDEECEGVVVLKDELIALPVFAQTPMNGTYKIFRGTSEIQACRVLQVKQENKY